MTFQDKTLSCKTCNEPFLFSAGEQAFYASKGLANDPVHCPNCRLRRKLERQGKDGQQVTEVVCAQCGAVTHVPFKPTGRAPVYCAPCMLKQRDAETGDKS